MTSGRDQSEPLGMHAIVHGADKAEYGVFPGGIPGFALEVAASVVHFRAGFDRMAGSVEGNGDATIANEVAKTRRATKM